MTRHVPPHPCCGSEGKRSCLFTGQGEQSPGEASTCAWPHTMTSVPKEETLG